MFLACNHIERVQQYSNDQLIQSYSFILFYTKLGYIFSSVIVSYEEGINSITDLHFLSILNIN